MPSNGALFVGYVMILAFVSSPLELIRIPELVIYVYNRLIAVTRLEREKALHKVIKSQENVTYCIVGNLRGVRLFLTGTPQYFTGSVFMDARKYVCMYT